MVYENIQVSNPNFCIGPKSDNYGSIDHDADVLRFRNDSGGLVTSYSLDTGVNEIRSLEYTGPRNVDPSYDQFDDFEDKVLQFFTLERDGSTQCTIREWRIDQGNGQLDLENTITKTTGGSYYFNCYDMAVEYYLTDFDMPGGTVTGTGFIEATDDSKMEVGDRLLLGPSSDVTNQYAMEWVEVTAISGGKIYIDSITSPGTTPPLYEYVDADDITFTKAIYLFSDIGENNNPNGGLYKLHPYTGNVIEVHNSGIYHSNEWPSPNWSAAAWSIDYDAVGFVRGVNLLYVDPNNNYEISRSQTLTNINPDKATIFPVYGLAFENSSIYRLQKQITLRYSTNSNYFYESWSDYSFHQDTISPYTLSVDVTGYPRSVIPHGDTMVFNVVVRDQFGVGLSGKTVTFTKTGDSAASIGFYTTNPAVPDNTVVTNSSGVATINYLCGSYDYTLSDQFEYVTVHAETDGGSSDLGVSGYDGSIWDNIQFILHKGFFFERELIDQVDDEFESNMYLDQIEPEFDIEMYLKSLSKFQFPGGHWGSTGAPTDTTRIIEQLTEFTSDQHLDQIDSEFDIDIYADQLKDHENDLQLSQTYVSRHVLDEHFDTATLDQFQFVVDAIPPFWSEKNPVDTNIWIRIRPFEFSLNQATLVFKVREISYAGDTGFIDVTSSCVVNTFDAGVGLLGLDITYDPPSDFHHNGVVYVYLEVYDQAPTPNIIITEYWFKIIPDYKAPYIENEDPAREEMDVAINTDISFDLFDAGVGVDIDTLEFFVNNRQKTPTYSPIAGGYHVTYNPSEDFFYGETVEITVKVDDVRGNTLYDMWRFYCIGSTGPWIDLDSFYPALCTEGIKRKTDKVEVNIYGIDGTGVDRESILMHVGGKERNVKIRPIIYRSS